MFAPALFSPFKLAIIALARGNYRHSSRCLTSSPPIILHYHLLKTYVFPAWVMQVLVVKFKEKKLAQVHMVFESEKLVISQ